MSIIITISFTFIFLAICFENVLGQKDTLLQEIHVVDTRLNNDSFSGFKQQLLDAQELKYLNVCSLSDALRSFSGVFIRDYGGVGGLKTVSIRSLGAEHTAILHDGVQQIEASTGQIDVGMLSTHHLSSIRLSQGVSVRELLPARTYLSANVIHLNSYFASDTSVAQKQYLIKLQGGNFGLLEKYGNVSFPLSQNLKMNYLSWARYAHGEYPYHYQNGIYTTRARRQNSEVEQLRQEIRTYLRFTPVFRWHSWVYGSVSKRQLPGAVIDYIQHSQQALVQQEYVWQNTFHSDLSKWQFRFDIKTALQHLRYTDPLFLNSSGGIDDRFSQMESYFSVAARHQWNFFTLGMAIDNSFQNLQSSRYMAQQPSRNAVHAAGGIYYRRNRISAELNGVGIIVKERNPVELLPLRNHVLPSSSICFQTNTGNYKASIRKTMRLPTFNDMYYVRLGNLTLRPEIALQYQLATSQTRYCGTILRKLNWDVAFFYILTQDKIIAVPTQNLFIWSVRNVGRVQTTGAELGIEQEFFPIGKYIPIWVIHYTFQRAIDITESSSPTFRHQIAYTPQHIFQQSIRLRSNSIQFHYTASFTGVRYALGENIPSNRLEEFWLHDVGLHYKIYRAKYKVEMNISVNNLLSARYAIIRSFPMPERNGQVGCLISF
ncbi:MAG: TonB-dependent receptor plug domain-containing protein [Cytophagales bacterium]|nr:TonB-dependent receptor plug domain-containing protein [Cytophagales bacterium]MDW8384776.1 TonB-dependent receptor plug domain-containing protein [Flammeovirgaceae bacterium]